MASIVAGVVDVGKTPTMIAPVTGAGLLVQNIGDGAVTIGGESVKWEQGLLLLPHTDPLLIPSEPPPPPGSGAIVVGQPPAEADSAANVYAVSLGGDGKVAYLSA